MDRFATLPTASSRTARASNLINGAGSTIDRAMDFSMGYDFAETDDHNSPDFENSFQIQLSQGKSGRRPSNHLLSKAYLSCAAPR
jgi:hypothetical protein